MCDRILIIGNSGSGKTTLGRRLGKALGWRQIDLDDLQDGNGVPEASEQWQTRVREELEQTDQWITSGRDMQTLPIQAALADLVVVLELPPPLCAYRALVRRPLMRLLGGEDMLSQEARKKRSLRAVILRWLSWPRLGVVILAYPFRERPYVFKVLKQVGHDRGSMVVLRSAQAIEGFLRSTQLNGLTGAARPVSTGRTDATNQSE